MERTRIVDEATLNYEGIFSLPELFQKIDQTIEKIGYNKRENSHIEKVTESSKSVTLALEPWKKVTEYGKYIMVISFIIKNIKDKVVIVDGRERKFQTGKILVRLSAFVETTLEHHWTQQPFYYFLLGVIDKYIWKIRWYSIFSNYQEAVADDLGTFRYEILSFLNNYKYVVGSKKNYLRTSPIAENVEFIRNQDPRKL